MKGVLDNTLSGVTNTMKHVYSPNKSCIQDMVMIQLISVCLTMFLILGFMSRSMTATQVSWLMAGLFAILTFTGLIYNRLSRY
jgi:hypothetical protein